MFQTGAAPPVRLVRFSPDHFAKLYQVVRNTKIQSWLQKILLQSIMYINRLYVCIYTAY